MEYEVMNAKIREIFYKMDREENKKAIRDMYQYTTEWERNQLWCVNCRENIVNKGGDFCEECKTRN